MPRHSARITASLGFGLALAASVLVSPSAAHAESSHLSAPPPVTASKLFVQDAQAATVERKRGKRWKITLTGVNATTLWFADRPERDAGRQSTRSFVREWADFGFAADPPNAVIQHSDADGVAVELKNPRYDRKAATLTYTAIIDPGSGKRLARTMTDVSIFIDDAGYTMTPVRFEIRGAAPDSTVMINLSEPSGEPDPNYAAFSVGGPGSTEGIPTTTLLDTDSNAATPLVVPIRSLTVDATRLEVTLGSAPEDFDNTVLNFSLSLFIMTAPGVTDIEIVAPGTDVGSLFIDMALGDDAPLASLGPIPGVIRLPSS